MKNLYNTVTIFQNIAEAHPEVNGIYYGDINEYLSAGTFKYVAVHFESGSAQIFKGYLQATIQITVLDVPFEDLSNRLEVESKTMQVLNDIIGEFDMGITFSNLDSRDYSINQPLNINPLQAPPDFPNRVLGWIADIVVNLDYCKTGETDSIIGKDIGAFSPKQFSTAFNIN